VYVVVIASLALAYGWGIVGVWIGLDVLIAARLALLARASPAGAGPSSASARGR
jgi:hypothetical protein